MYKDIDQINIEENIYDPENFEDPPERDPTLRVDEEDDECQCCGFTDVHDMCDVENFRNCEGYPVPLFELAEMPAKGVGIRALRNYKRGNYLGEYKGVLMDVGVRPREWTYSLLISKKGKNGEEGEEIATVDAHQYGNWVRYLNHSYAHNTSFAPYATGDRMFMSAIAMKDIKIFEEMTINYGDEYFALGRIRCLCGEPQCEWNGTEEENLQRYKEKKEKEEARKRKRKAAEQAGEDEEEEEEDEDDEDDMDTS